LRVIPEVRRLRRFLQVGDLPLFVGQSKLVHQLIQALS